MVRAGAAPYARPMSRWCCAFAIVCAATLATLVVACGYDAPDYGDAHFRCDVAHPCPAGQECVADLCQPPGTATDAASDAIDIDGLFGGIACGTATCTLDQECCADVVGGIHCQNPGAVCAGISTRCDGPEDCGGGECCLTAGAGECTAIGTCGTAIACHDTNDCGGGSSTCCAILNTAWRGCFENCP